MTHTSPHHRVILTEAYFGVVECYNFCMKEETTQHSEHKEMERLMRQNSELIKENNALLKKIHRGNLIQLWTRILWYLIIIGAPFALYFLVRDYFDALGADYEIFKAGMKEIPGLKNLQGW